MYSGEMGIWEVEKSMVIMVCSSSLTLMQLFVLEL
jgi:hypothetical protein